MASMPSWPRVRRQEGTYLDRTLWQSDYPNTIQRTVREIRHALRYVGLVHED